MRNPSRGVIMWHCVTKGLLMGEYDDKTEIALVKERIERMKEDIAALKGNQKTAVVAILSLVLNAIFQFIQKGGGQ